MADKLPRVFYARPTLEVAPDLLGKILVRKKGRTVTSGRIVEVEAYCGLDDPASHAFRGPSLRSAIMFGAPGHAYVYFIYGMYFCVNVVTEKTGTAGACLIRALEPQDGVAIMKKRRGTGALHELTNGPGKLCRAMAIDRTLNGADYRSDNLFILDAGERVPVRQSPRIGIRHAADRPWRFYEAGNAFVSRSE